MNNDNNIRPIITAGTVSTITAGTVSIITAEAAHENDVTLVCSGSHGMATG